MAKPKISIKEWFSKLKHKEVVIAIVAIVVMLCIYFSTKTSVSTTSAVVENYCDKVHGEICNAVIKISGDRNAKIVINWSGSVEKEYAKSENTSSNGSSSTITIVQGSSGANALVVKEKYPQVVGVVVVIKNANEPKIKVEIMQMLMTLFDVNSEKIGVFSGK